jgi:hypothetical protein
VGDWWNNIPTFEKIFWYFAIPFTVVFIIQTILTFIGMGDDVDIGEGDGDLLDGVDSSFPIFTVRNFIIFFTVFGWTGIAATNGGLSKGTTVVLAVLIGLIVMFIVAGIFYFMSRLVESGNIDLNNAVNCVGEVYLTIPEKRAGMGKIQIEFQGGVREINAVTDGKTLHTGEMVKVVKVLENHVLLVEKFNE